MRLTDPAMRIFRAVDCGVEDDGFAGMMRAPQEGHLVAAFSIGSAQRQHALLITDSPRRNIASESGKRTAQGKCHTQIADAPISASD